MLYFNTGTPRSSTLEAHRCWMLVVLKKPADLLAGTRSRHNCLRKSVKLSVYYIAFTVPGVNAKQDSSHWHILGGDTTSIRCSQATRYLRL